jgi:hypothetical protein
MAKCKKAKPSGSPPLESSKREEQRVPKNRQTRNWSTSLPFNHGVR